MKPITIGSDCSGIEAPIEALNQMNIEYKHVCHVIMINM